MAVWGCGGGGVSIGQYVPLNSRAEVARVSKVSGIKRERQNECSEKENPTENVENGENGKETIVSHSLSSGGRRAVLQGHWNCDGGRVEQAPRKLLHWVGRARGFLIKVAFRGDVGQK